VKKCTTSVNNNFWGVFTSDGTYDATSTWKSTVFQESRTYQDTKYDNRWSSNIYSNNAIQIKAKVEIQTTSWGICGWFGASTTVTVSYHGLSNGYSYPNPIEVSAYGGLSKFYFTIYKG
jgi:hypothetical protein